jgi:PIN domain nuclease of toxin-antitoxin system
VSDLLLDSHTLLWALYSPAVLPGSLVGLLRDSTTNLFVSEGSVWELSDKAGKGRLPLAGNDVSQLMRDIEALGAKLLPIERTDILASVTLPPHHGDPFDRLFIAQARARSLVLVSKDADVAKYDVAVLWK